MTLTELKAKVCLLGDLAVGKTSLINRYVIDRFDDRYISTFGTKVMKKETAFELSGKGYKVTLMIWDVLGQEGFSNVLRGALRDANGAMIVCDLTRRSTLNNTVKWIKKLYNIAGAVPIVFLANKSDLRDQYEFKESDVKKLAQQYRVPYYITSAKSGDHVTEAFEGIAKETALVLRGIKTIEVPDFLKEGDIVVRAAITIEDIETPIDLEDYMVKEFCDYMGGQEFAMPIIRQQIRRLKFNFADPKIEDLKALRDSMVMIVHEFRGEIEGERLRRELNRAIDWYERIHK